MKELDWIGLGVGLAAALVFALVILGVYEDTKSTLETNYLMPNGIVCKSSTITGGGFGGATHEFYRCSDHNRYVNPETYKRIKSKNKVTFSDVLLGVAE